MCLSSSKTVLGMPVRGGGLEAAGSRGPPVQGFWLLRAAPISPSMSPQDMLGPEARLRYDRSVYDRSVYDRSVYDCTLPRPPLRGNLHCFRAATRLNRCTL